MFEYLWLLGFWREPIWGINSWWEVLTYMISGMALVFLGYIIKGVWGAFIAFGLGTGFYLYVKGILPF